MVRIEVDSIQDLGSLSSDREHLLMASKALLNMTNIANLNIGPPSQSFTAECAYYAAELVDMAMRLESAEGAAERRLEMEATDAAA